jgi:hypothetical protein
VFTGREWLIQQRLCHFTLHLTLQYTPLHSTLYTSHYSIHTLSQVDHYALGYDSLRQAAGAIQQSLRLTILSHRCRKHGALAVLLVHLGCALCRLGLFGSPQGG